MLEFAATGGPGKAVQAATVQAITKGVAKTALQKATAKQVGRVARVTAQAGLMVPMGIAKYGEQRLGPWMVTDKGQVIFTESMLAQKWQVNCLVQPSQSMRSTQSPNV